MKIKILFISILLMSSNNIFSQNFAEKCIGTWDSYLQIYSYGQLRDSVKVEFTVARTDDENTFVWKTNYISEKRPMIKDYKLVLIDLEKGHWQTNEGEGIVLDEYQFDDLLIANFETGGILISSKYQIIDKDHIYFELSSSKKEETNSEVKNFKVNFLQKMMLTRRK